MKTGKVSSKSEEGSKRTSFGDCRRWNNTEKPRGRVDAKGDGEWIRGFETGSLESSGPEVRELRRTELGRAGNVWKPGTGLVCEWI